MRAGKVKNDQAPFGEDRDPFETANLYPRTTGLPVTVWVSPRGGAKHDVRVKVSSAPGDWMDIADASVVGVRPEPALLHGSLPPESFAPVQRWIRLNTPALVAYWDGEIDTVELAGRLKRL